MHLVYTKGRLHHVLLLGNEGLVLKMHNSTKRKTLISRKYATLIVNDFFNVHVIRAVIILMELLK